MHSNEAEQHLSTPALRIHLHASQCHSLNSLIQTLRLFLYFHLFPLLFIPLLSLSFPFLDPLSSFSLQLFSFLSPHLVTFAVFLSPPSVSFCLSPYPCFSFIHRLPHSPPPSLISGSFLPFSLLFLPHILSLSSFSLPLFLFNFHFYFLSSHTLFSLAA